MDLLPFQSSKNLTLGIELELQIINPFSFDLFPRAKDLIRNIKGSLYENFIKPEITQSMVEINSSAHEHPSTLEDEINHITEFLNWKGKKLGLLFSGGGIHPFQQWPVRKIFPTQRFREVSKRYKYLAKRFTVFAQHIHIGCTHPNDALYLTHVLSRYIPQLIAISASSPFYQGNNTGFYSSRINIVNAFPLYGMMPFVKTWEEFTDYYNKMLSLNIIDSMKDFYWDVRPKPEFGTVEVRVCDTSLTTKKAVCIAAYVQTLARHILFDKPYEWDADFALTYSHNRFQAARYGYDGDFINPFTKKRSTIHHDISVTIDLLKPHMLALGTKRYIDLIVDEINQKQNDASLLKKIYSEQGSFKKLVNIKTQMWSQNLNNC